MSHQSFEKFDDADLIRMFADTAATLGEIVNNWLGSGAKESHKLNKIGNILRSRGKHTRLLLTPLLRSDNRFVKYYAAIELEGLLPDPCRRIIEENAKQGDAIAGDAGMHLHAIESGIYRPD